MWVRHCGISIRLARIAKYNGAYGGASGMLAIHFVSCTTAETTYGDVDALLATTGNRMTVMSGMVVNSDRYAVSYNIN